DLLPPKPKYNPLWNESLSSLEEGPSGSTPPEELPSPSASSLGPILPPLSGDDSPTTLCSFFPRMSNQRLANWAGGYLGPKGEPGRAADDGEGIIGADMNKLSGGGGCRTQVEAGQLGGEEWTHHGSSVNKPMQGWLHPNDKVMGPGVSYLIWYMGCVEILQSMSTLDFNTWTQVTREAINQMCEAVLGAKGVTRKRKPCSHPLSSILGRSNLNFAGMPITLTTSTSSLNLMVTDCKQIITNYHMQSILFASSGDPDTAKYVANVAKDPVNWKACHILECPEGLAQDVISTIGQAFELHFKQYLRKPPKSVTPHDRMTGFDDLAWDEEEEEPPHHQLREAATLGAAQPSLPSAQTPSHLGPVGGDPEVCKQMPPPPPCPGRELFDDPSCVNMQNLDKARQAGSGAGPPNPAISGSTTWDLFDMKPFEDALHVPPPPQLMSWGLRHCCIWTKDHHFESVSHLISYHMDYHLPIISVGSKLCLQQPVERKL
uniref:PID domain-containing protein n=1 Tax=Mandrillus leucophaeus TaxID=9568 RepID=A0A2K5ZI89_MANLE